MPDIAWPLLEIDSSGMVWIEGTRIKVIEIALDRIAHHWDSDEIRRQHPQLSLAQIHAALAYYCEHQAECDLLIADRSRFATELSSELRNNQLQTDLQSRARR